MGDSSARKVILTCGNELWLKKPLPHIGELLWCTRCNNYCEVGPGEARTAETYYPDYHWTSKPHPVSGWVGRCDADRCHYSSHERHKWYDLKDRMERHYLKEHSGSSLASHMEIVPVPALPRNSAPPF